MERPGLYVLGGVVLPTLAMWASQILVPEWRTGADAEQLLVFFAPELTGLFLPLFAFASAMLFLQVSDPDSGSFVRRLGLWTGSALSLQYIVLAALSRPEMLGFALCVFIPFCFFWMMCHSGLIGGVGVVMGSFVAPVVPMIALYEIEPNGLFLLSWLVATLAAAPMYSLVTYGSLLWAMPRPPFGPWHTAVAPWVIAYAATWRVALRRVEEVYSALPPNPPSGDCYIATAAANGHGWLVGSRLSGGVMINRQTRVLKAAELALARDMPRVHRRMRRVYDALGPRLARLLVHRVSADAAYLFLKPFEWLGWEIVRRSALERTGVR